MKRPWHYTHRPMSVLQKAFYWLAATLLVWPVRWFFKLRLVNGENLPLGGGMLLAANHPSYLDPPLICLEVSWWTQRIVRGLAKIELFQNPFLAWLIAAQGAIAIDRSNGRPTLVQVVRILSEQQGIVLYFPEGSRSEGREGRMGHFHTGVIVAAIQSGVPIVPIAIEGTDLAWRKGMKWPRRQRVVITVGQPYTIASPENSTTQIDKDFLEAQAVSLRQKIGQLLPQRLGPED